MPQAEVDAEGLFIPGYAVFGQFKPTADLRFRECPIAVTHDVVVSTAVRTARRICDGIDGPLYGAPAAMVQAVEHALAWLNAPSPEAD